MGRSRPHAHRILSCTLCRSGADSRVQTWNFRSDRDGSCGTVPSDASGHERLDPVSFAIHAQVCCCSQALMISRATLGMDGDPGPADDWTPPAPPSGSASLVGCDEAELSGGGRCPALLRGFVVSFCLRCAHSRASARAHTHKPQPHTRRSLPVIPPHPKTGGPYRPRQAFSHTKPQALKNCRCQVRSSLRQTIRDSHSFKARSSCQPVRIDKWRYQCRHL